MDPHLRHIGRSLDASRIFVENLASKAKHGAEEPEPWPRPTRPSPWRPRRLGLALWPLVVAVVAAQQLWDSKPDTASAMPAAQTVRAPLSVPPSSVPPPPAAVPQTAAVAPAPLIRIIHIRASRASSAGFVIDDVELPWRKLRAGDEFLSRPREKLVIDTDDWQSITATLDGKPVTLGPESNVIRIK